MKRLISTIICILMVVLTLFGCSKGENNATIFVATDTHYLSSKINDKGEAFQKMLANSDGKMVEYCDEIFDAFSDEIIKDKPDVLILSGDLSFNGEKKSHKDFVKKLKKIQDNGVQVLTIAGNHDIDNKKAIEYKGSEFLETESVSANEFKELYYDFGIKQAESVDDYSLSYLYKVNNGLYILMVDTNAYGQNFVQYPTFNWIEEQLKIVQNQNAKVIAVSHQNLFAHNDQLSFGYQIYNASDLLNLYKKYNVSCNLSGHIHLQHIKEDGIAEIATSSLLVSPAQYGILKFGNSINYKTKAVDVEGWAKNNNIKNENLLNFKEYAAKAFIENGQAKSLALLKELDYTENEKEEIAKAFSKLNSSYFAGTKCNTRDIKKGIKLIQSEENFLSKYAETMLEEANNDYNKATIKN